MTGTLFGSPADTYLKKGKDYFGLFQYQQACENLEKAIAFDPGGFEAHYYLGLSLRKLNQLEKAARILEKAVQLDPDETDCRKALGSIYLKFAKDEQQAGNRERMLDNLRKGCIAYPQNTPVWVTLFEHWSGDRRWQAIAEAAKHIRQHNQAALEAGDDTSLQKALILAAKACIALEDHGTARDYLTQAGRIRTPNDELLRLKSALAQKSSQVATDLAGEGRAAIAAGNYKLAIEILQKARSAEPSNSEISDMIDQAQKRQTILDFIASADAAEKKGDLETCLAQINRAIEFSEGDKQLEERAASLAASIDKKNEAGAKAKAAAIARKQAQLDQNQKLAAMLKAAEESEAKGAFEAAVLSYQQALALNGEDPDIKVSLERAQKATAKEKERIEAYTARFSEAVHKLEDENKPDEAFAIFKELSENPLNPRIDLLPYLLKASTSMQRWSDTATFLTELSKIASESDHIDYYSGLLAFRNGDYKTAWEPLAALQKRNPGYADDIGSMIWRIRFEKYKSGLFVILAFIMYLLYRPIMSSLRNLREARIDSAISAALSGGRYADAIPLLEARLDDSTYMGGNRKQLTISLADAYLKQGRFAEAAAQASAITKRDPKNPNAQRILGEASFQLGDRSSEGLERMIGLYRLDEARRDVLSFLAERFRAEKHESKAALEILTRQFQISPDDKETLFYLANFYEKRQNFSAATLKIFERAARFGPEMSRYQVSLAACFLQVGKQDEAVRIIEKALEKWPDDPELLRIQAGLATMQSPGTAVPTSAPVPIPEIADDSTPGSVPTADQVKCPHCGNPNSPREYYCATCGKPLR